MVIMEFYVITYSGYIGSGEGGSPLLSQSHPFPKILVRFLLKQIQLTETRMFEVRIEQPTPNEKEK